MAVIDPTRTWAPVEERVPRPPRACARTIDADGLIVGEDAYQTGPVSVTKLSREGLPQKYIDQKNNAAAQANA